MKPFFAFGTLASNVHHANVQTLKIKKDFGLDYSKFGQDLKQTKQYKKLTQLTRKQSADFFFFFSQKLRITFECGLHSSADFIFFFSEKVNVFPLDQNRRYSLASFFNFWNFFNWILLKIFPSNQSCEKETTEKPL